MGDQTRHIDRLLRKLGLLVTLDAAEIEAISSLPFDVQDVRAHRMLVREGDDVTRCCVLVEGYACRHKMTRTGKRQIVGFQMAGDILDLQHSLLPRADHNVQMITPGTVAWIATDALLSVMERFPRIAEALAKEALVNAAIFREWVLNVGSRDARTRVAHMLCEFAARREAVGISPVGSSKIPMTQEQIGDATGLTPVHVNRMLRVLSEEGAFNHEGRDYYIADWPKLKAIGEFDPAYLHGTV